MRRAWIVLLTGCAFSGASGTPNGPPPDGSLPDSTTGDGGMQVPGRRIQLTIASGRVTEALTDFPVYVDLTQDELKTRLDPMQLSFKRRTGGTVENLPYELQSFEQATGRLRAWVLLPSLSNTADNVFELRYGDASAAAAANPPEVWRNRYRAVFHLESATAPIVNSRQNMPGTPMNLPGNALVDAQLGRGIDFRDDNNAVISFTNPISGGGPSTISVWVSQRNSNDKDALVALGSGIASQARWLHAEFNNDEVGLGLFDDDWTSTGLPLRNAGWSLLHWTYQGQVSRLYRDGVLSNGSPFNHTGSANTAGTSGWLGNVKSPGFDTNAALNGVLDEVHIADVVRSAGWIAAEHANQANPGQFVTAAAPQPIP